MNKLIILCTLLLTPLLTMEASASQIRVYVSDVNAIGTANRDEMKMTLQSLLSSRLNGDRILAVGSAAEADVLISGTYVAIGKIFSVDALARTVAGKTLARAFVQGDNQDELIPSIGKLADKLSADLIKLQVEGDVQASVPAPPSKGPSDILRQPQEAIRRVPAEDIIRQEKQTHTSASGEKGWISRRLPGAANILAVGAALPDGSREVFLGQDNRVQYFRQGEVMKLIATVDFRANEKVISVDAADADGDGRQELYITVIRGGELASQVWEVQGDKLVRIPGDFPYYFHSISLGGGLNRLYLQEMSPDQDFFGDLYEAHRNGSTITKGNPIKLPRYGNIYNFNQFKAKDGTTLSVVISGDGYLTVYNQEKKEMWRSNDRFGGTNLYFEREDQQNVRSTGELYRKVFLGMRIQVTAKNEVVVGRNEGTFVVGNVRFYKKGSVYCFQWDGSSLEELWRTREVQNYMPDYWFDEVRSELLLLQMPQKPGPGEEGAASLAIKKVE
jgi:hypothetical protein